MKAKNEKQRVTWQEIHRTLTLTGEPVLELDLSWPQVEGKRMWGLNRYYARLCERWRRHWEREGYWQACVDLAQQRERSHPFYIWKANLSGQVMLDRGGLLSISMMAREVRGDGRALEYRWGDTWRWEDGSAVMLRDLFLEKKRWCRRLEQELEEAVQVCRRQGIYLDEELRTPLRRWLSTSRFALSENGLELYYPQCTLAPAVEGAVTLRIPMPDGVHLEEEREEKKEA